MVKIQLISAPVDEENKPSVMYDQGSFPPSHLARLANYIITNGGHEAEIFDGQHMTIEEIIPRLNAQYVGINFTIQSSGNLAAITRVAKENGSTVIVGGQAATPLAEQLLSQNKDIDYVVRREGEWALKGILDNKSPNQIPNLSYRKDGRTVHNHLQKIPFKTLPALNFEIPGIELDKYFAASDNPTMTGNHGYSRPLNAYTARGCPRRINNKGCFFCARVDQGINTRTPEQTVEEYIYLIGLGPDAIRDDADSWLIQPQRLEEIAKIVERHGGLGIPLHVYGDPGIITPQIADLAQKIGVYEVLLGVESGNQEILNANGKQIPLDRICDTVVALRERGIRTAQAFVGGLYGETPETLTQTIDFAKELSNIGPKETHGITYLSTMTPLPGSNAWNLMINRNAQARERFGNEYRLGLKELQKYFIENYTNLGKNGMKLIQEGRKEIFRAEEVRGSSTF